MLWKKMYRDIWNNRGSYLAILVIVFIALIVFTAFSIASDNLGLSRDQFYHEQNFAHGFVELGAMPQSRVDYLTEIQGIDQIQGRIVEEVRVYDPPRDEPVYLDLVSVGLQNHRMINGIYLLEGQEVLNIGNMEAWLDNQFYDTHNLTLGEEVEIIAQGRVMELMVQGQGMSPEFTYPLRTETEMLPDPEQYGIAFLSYQDIVTLFPDMENRVNELIFTLEPGANYEYVEDQLESELEQYGVETIYPREDQTSHLMLTQEVEMLERVSYALPVTFLGIAGIILFIMLKRLIEQQRGQIGILKAFGYTNREVVLHYLSYAIVIGSIGGLIGGVVGIYLANPLTSLLMTFFNVPQYHEGFSFYYLALGLLMSLSIFMVAGFLGCRQVLKLNPAESMRPPTPVSGKKVVLEKISVLWSIFTIQGKMAIRNLFRNRGRSLFLFVGITFSCAVVALTWSLNDLVDLIIFYQYDEVEVYDARVTLRGPIDRDSVLRELSNQPEVDSVDALIEVPVSLSNYGMSEDVTIMGIPADTRKYRILDSHGNRLPPSSQGVILSERLADKLQVRTGDTVELESPLLNDNIKSQRLLVVEIIPQYLGMNGYMEINALQEVLNQGDFITSAMVNVSSSEGDTDLGLRQLRDRYRESEKVTAIDGLDERISQSREMMDTFGSVIYIYVLIGVVICFAIIYSSSFIILSERSREMASMRVLGMTPGEVFSVITFEQWFISVFAIIASIPLAQIMLSAMAEAFSTDFYSLPSELSNTSLAVGAVITVISIWTAQRFALSKVKKLSLVEVLKARE